MMKKGITPVVTTILLLLIAVVVIGLAFVFFQRVMTNVTDTAGDQIGNSTSNLGKGVSIDNVNSVSVTVRNTGTVPIALGEINVYVGGVAITATQCGWGTGTLAIGRTATCNLPVAITCASPTIVKVTNPGPTGEDTAACP